VLFDLTKADWSLWLGRFVISIDLLSGSESHGYSGAKVTLFCRVVWPEKLYPSNDVFSEQWPKSCHHSVGRQRLYWQVLYLSAIVFRKLDNVDESILLSCDRSFQFKAYVTIGNYYL